MPEARANRRQERIAQNFANQLAQMAVGAEAMFTGAVLKHEPVVGIIEIDLVSISATVNGRPCEFALIHYLNKWMVSELARKSLDSSWIRSAIVTINYSWVPGNASTPDWAEFKARAVVHSGSGETLGTFTNNQPLVG